jgi:predicted ATPase
VSLRARFSGESTKGILSLSSAGLGRPAWAGDAGGSKPIPEEVGEWLKRVRMFSFNAHAIGQPVQLQPGAELGENGAHLAGVLTQLQDRFPERFDALNAELARWMPEFDRVLFDTPLPGQRSFLLRTRAGKHPIPAGNLSDGTLFVLCLLTLTSLPAPPSMVCLEEPDHGVHPRLLRHVHDAMMRLSNPEQFGDDRKPVQVVATTHSPYLLDLFRDHPEDVVLANKEEGSATFRRLVDLPHYADILHDAQLSDAWYSGVLGGVPATP